MVIRGQAQPAGASVGSDGDATFQGQPVRPSGGGGNWFNAGQRISFR